MAKAGVHESELKPDSKLVENVEARKTVTDKAIRKHRRKIIDQFAKGKNRAGMEWTASLLGVSPSALYGMIRGDVSRYSEGTLQSMLEKIDCTSDN